MWGTTFNVFHPIVNYLVQRLSPWQVKQEMRTPPAPHPPTNGMKALSILGVVHWKYWARITFALHIRQCFHTRKGNFFVWSNLPIFSFMVHIFFPPCLRNFSLSQEHEVIPLFSPRKKRKVLFFGKYIRFFGKNISSLFWQTNFLMLGIYDLLLILFDMSSSGQYLIFLKN